MQQGEIDELQLTLDKLKYGIKKDDGNDNNNNNNNRGRGGGCGRGTPGPPGPPGPPTTPQQEMDDIVRSLDYLRGNTPDVSPDNTREQNSRIIAQKIMKSLLINKLNKDKEKFQICQKELLIKKNQV